MAVAAGTYELGPQCGRLLVKTSRTGLGSKAGHDLTSEVTRWSGRAFLGALKLKDDVLVEFDVALRQPSAGW